MYAYVYMPLYIKVHMCVWLCSVYIHVCMSKLGVNLDGHSAFTIHLISEDSFPHRCGAYRLGKTESWGFLEPSGLTSLVQEYKHMIPCICSGG